MSTTTEPTTYHAQDCQRGVPHWTGTCCQPQHARDRARGLRDLADLLDAHPDLAGSRFSSVDNYIHVENAAEFATLVRQMGGTRAKTPSDRWMTVNLDLGGGVTVKVHAPRDEVCEQVVVGTETVEVEEVVTPAVTRTATVERDVVEWVCGSVLDAERVSA